MYKQEKIIEVITGKGLLPLYYHPSCYVSINVLKALYNAGIRAVEYTNRGENARYNFKALKQACRGEMEDMYVGIGTVKDAETAQLFIEAGADFIVSPGFDVDVAAVVRRENMLWIPGCMTPAEIMQAEKHGANMIKLFPGGLLGAPYLSAVKEVFPSLFFMPTGGVGTTYESLAEWFAAGVCAVGAGSKILSKTAMEQVGNTTITTLVAELLETIDAIRKNLVK